MYDVINNHMIAQVLAPGTEAIQANTPLPGVNGIDLWQAGTNLPNVVGLLIHVGALGGASTLDVIVQDSPDLAVWDLDFVTAAQIVAPGLYYVEVHDPNRYLRVNISIAVNTVDLSIILFTFDEQRRPVTQLATTTQPLLTYGAGRLPKVAII
jgi:hypothetical protein